MSILALFKASDIFKAGVAGAPVTFWEGYDTHYTERYLGLPKENSSGYRNSCALNHARNMTGKLMLIHGMIDENVHFRHSVRLIEVLNTLRKDYDLVLFPNERHMPRSLADRIFLEEKIFRFFEKEL